MPARKRIYIAYTGGTIGMVHTPQGYQPQAGFLQRSLESLSQLSHREMPAIEVHEYPELLDSSQMAPEDWNRIARDIHEHYYDFDGFVVLHGTDTMAYTASALSFMLPGLSKPVIFTGSQIPLTELRSDARDNLIGAVLLAATSDICEVCVFFHGKLFRGNRVTKVSADDFSAFSSPNHPPLAELGVDIEIHTSARRGCGEILRMQPLQPMSVAALRLFPGLSPHLLETILAAPTVGLILETYGAGNAPTKAALLDVLAEATARGVVIVNCTQCLYGGVAMHYATGRALAHVGVIPGFDMTAEAALAKLYYLLSCDLPRAQVLHHMQRNLRGELRHITRPTREDN